MTLQHAIEEAHNSTMSTNMELVCGGGRASMNTKPRAAQRRTFSSLSNLVSNRAQGPACSWAQPSRPQKQPILSGGAESDRTSSNTNRPVFSVPGGRFHCVLLQGVVNEGTRKSVLWVFSGTIHASRAKTDSRGFMRL